MSSSPRHGGNSELLLESFLEGLEGEAGVNVHKVYLSDLNVQPCTQCDRCLEAGICPINDDMKAVYDFLEKADVIALATPIYFMGPCAQAKLMIDRCQPFWARKYHLKRDARAAKRRGILLAVGATRGPKVFEGLRTTAKWWLDALEGELWKELLINEVEAKGAIREHPTALREAKVLGRAVAEGEGL